MRPVTIFYALPAELLTTGVSTDDGQDVLDVSQSNGSMYVTVYTPRSDDPDADAHNRCGPELRVYDRDQLIALAVFDDTAVDLSEHPQAQYREVR